MADTESTRELALVAEARRLCQRYIDEVVLEYDLCPWAEPALRGSRVQIAVITAHLRTEYDFDDLAKRAADELAKAAETTELVLLVFPRCRLGRLRFDGFQRRLRELLTREHTRGGEPAFALAAFHPEAPADAGSPERLIPYLRRSPDALLQAVRTRSLERLETHHGGGTGFVGPEQMLRLVQGPPPPDPLRLRIARANAETFGRVGQAAFDARFADLRADRERSYVAIEPELLASDPVDDGGGGVP